MTQIFIDECGYTGADLANSEQPVFVLASVDFSEDACEALKDRHFSNVKANELKHSRLSKSPAQQDMVVRLLEDLSSSPDSVKISATCKQYALVAKMVDLVIEPMAKADNIDIYDKGCNLAISNVLYNLIPHYAGRAYFDELLLRFQEFVRIRDEASFRSFAALLSEDQIPSQLEEPMILLRGCIERYGFNIAAAIPDDALDISFSCAFNLVSEWSKSKKDNIILVHDQSSNMAKNKRIWDNLFNPNICSKTIGYDRRKMDFPIGVEKTDFSNSKDWAGLQIVDILAGANARYLRGIINGNGGGYFDKLKAVISRQTYAHAIWPSLDVTPKDLGTNGPNWSDPLAFIADVTRDS